MKGRKWKINLHSLQWKFFVITLCIALSAMALSLGLCYMIAVQTIEGMTVNFMNEYIQYADSNLSSMMGNALSISLTISGDRPIVATTLGDTAREASYPWYIRSKSMESYLGGMIADKPYIKRAVIAVSDGRTYLSSSPIMRRQEMEEPWFQDAVAQQALQVRYEMGEDPRVLVSRPIPSARGIDAVVMLELDFDALVRVYDIDPLRTANMLVYTPQGDLFFTNSAGAMAETYPNLDFWPAVEADTMVTQYQTLQGERSFVALHRSSITGLSTVVIISEKSLILDAMHLNSQILGITLAAIVLAAVASIAFSFVLYKNLNNFMRTMKAVRSGRLDVRADIQSKDEIGELSITFNQMMNRIETLMEKVKTEEAKKREAEQNVLFAQIQPHFLYNAISAIQYVSNMRGEKDTEHMAIALSSLLRSVLGNHDEFITLWEEHEYIGSYMEIQRYKFQSEFTLTWDVEEALWSSMIPKLLLQPIVENALLHGIALKDSGAITVQAYTQEDMVVIRVIDDGNGMEEDTIAALNAGQRLPNGGARTFRNVGLPNVLSRLHLIYGERAGYRIHSEPGVFTCVELYYPRDRKEA